MSEHVNEWLNAYLDGELHGRRLHQVQEHLDGCESCQAEFESLKGLSGLLHKVPAPEFPSPERFATRVNLLLPQRPVTDPRNRLLEVGWWMIPVGLLAAWIFINTAGLVSNMISAASNFGLLGSEAALWITGSSDTVYWTSALARLVFEGSGLQWFEMTEHYSRNIIPQFIWHVSIALLYLTWIAIWWTRNPRQGHTQLRES